MKTKQLVVLPVCEFDEHLLIQNLMLLKYLGDSPPPAMIVVAPDCMPKNLEDIISKAESVFPSVTVLRIADGCGDRKWPRPQNHMFKRVCQDILWNKKCDFFYYMEADVTPIRKNAIMDLFALHESLGKPMLGIQCKVRTSDNKYDVTYVNGAAIYPMDIMYKAPDLITADRTSWDVMCRDHFLALYASGHTLMAHTFRSERFALAGENLDYVSLVDGTRKQLHLDHLAVVHGCKDGSLAALLMGPKVEAVPMFENKTVYYLTSPEPQVELPLPIEKKPVKKRARRRFNAVIN